MLFILSPTVCITLSLRYLLYLLANALQIWQRSEGLQKYEVPVSFGQMGAASEGRADVCLQELPAPVNLLLPRQPR